MARTIILATHGHLGEAVREACELVMGKQEDVDVMSIVAGVGADDIYHFFCDKIREAMEKSNALPLVLVDILGGSAYGQAVRMLKDYDISVITGLNLPMLLEVLMMRGELSYSELSDMACEVGKTGVTRMDRALLAAE